MVSLQRLQGGTIYYASKNQLSKLPGLAHKGTCTLLLIETPSLHMLELDNQDSLDEIATK